MTNVYVDSDIILDALLRREPFYLAALNLIELAHNNTVRLHMSSSSFINVNYFLRKFFLGKTIETLKTLRLVLSIVIVDADTIDSALNSGFSDFEDGVQYYAAISAKAEYIITRNVKDYKNATIPVLTAEQFLRTVIK
ncbi:PIN domain-containing protein [Mucilaginibacter ginkgonis]|uniref:PIN domain-containing protein n=1 Tax=Mucilaginibacter ginkgonis TaxID=2682091 RepID=A0A6I4I1C8_9SPHI|nr:PIN domain-containing protein [Mucilaginibacter ginkgonis]QQL48927.1 PIN domain-containing protein [Mucilaginibacter ginkgonis]